MCSSDLFPSHDRMGVDMSKENWVLALLSLVTAVVVSMKAKGLLKLIPIFCGIVVGYLAAWLFYGLDLSGVRDAAWIGLPQFVCFVCIICLEHKK